MSACQSGTLVAERDGVMVGREDVVLALMGAAGGIAGLTLVFLGLLVTARSAFPPATPKAILDRFRFPAAVVLAAFLIGVLCLAFSTGWLVDGGKNGALYVACLVTFSAQLVLLGLATLVVFMRIWDA